MTSVETYRLAFDISPMPLMLVRPAGTIALTNQAFDEMFEYPAGALAGQDVEILVPESRRSAHPALRRAFLTLPVKRAMGQGRDLHGRTLAGATIPLELGLHPVDVDDEIWIMVTAANIARRKSNEERMRLAMDATATAMVMVNAAGTIVFVNSAANSLFGYQERELIGKPMECLVPEDIRPVHSVYRSSFMIANNARRMGASQNIRARHKSGDLIPVEIGLQPLQTPDGEMVMSTIIDLTERHAAERERALHLAKLDELATDLSQFAYSASHDLKAPLTSISGLLAICLEDLAEGDIDEVRANLQKALAITERNKARIETVLKIAHADRTAAVHETFSLGDLLDEIWMTLTAAIPDPPSFDIAKAADVTLATERTTLALILENLLSNALRYRDDKKPDPRIAVAAQCNADMFSVSVSDNGVGIPRAAQHLVFEMFKRIDDRSGDGLGLALARKHIDRLGGEITFTSDEGKGTAFHLNVPLVSEAST